MKILCDVCRKEEAAIFCCADEAALCGACDGRVHLANKLAGKHCRLSLLHPATPEQSPLCDVCQEKRAFLFCQEDRAVLCRDCDSSIHSANDLTRKHTRFLLTGIKLSVSDAPAGLLPIAEVKDKNNSVYVPAVAEDSGEDTGSAASATSGSRISEYLMKELPGWHVEDLLLDTPSSGYGLPKMLGDHDLMSFPVGNLNDAAAAAADGGLFPALWVSDDCFIVPELGAAQTRRRRSDPPLHKRPRVAAATTATGGDLPPLPSVFFR